MSFFLPPSINLSTSIAQIFLKYSWKIFILINMNCIVENWLNIKIEGNICKKYIKVIILYYKKLIYENNI